VNEAVHTTQAEFASGGDKAKNSVKERVQRDQAEFASAANKAQSSVKEGAHTTQAEFAKGADKTKHSMKECIQICHCAEKGRILRCTRDVPAGHTLLVEQPAFLAQSITSKETAYAAFDQFKSLSKEAQSTILEEFYGPTDSVFFRQMLNQDSVVFQTYAAYQGAGGSKQMINQDNIYDFARLLTIVRFNYARVAPVKADGSGTQTSQDGRVGLYVVACKAAHSCAPNAKWYTQNDEGYTVMRSLVPIKEGDEVCLSYLSDELLRMSTKKRRKILSKAQEFLCKCTRCASSLDDTRVFKCPESPC